MPSIQYVLAIDLGTSGPKVALVAPDGTVHADEFEAVDLILTPGGGAEQDPAAWWEAIGAASRRSITAAGLEPDSISAVGVTAQWSGTVAVDTAGDALGNAIIWMDSRGADDVADLIGGPVRIEGYDPRKLRRWISRTGGAPARSGKDSLAHILYLRHSEPTRYVATDLFLEPKDYINLRLTGNAAASYDSITMHWVTDNTNPAAVTYDPELLDLVGLERRRLPDLVPATGVVGSLTTAAGAHLGLAAGIPVVAGTPDLHSAAIGSGAVADYAAHLYVGTSSWLICHVPFKKTDVFHSIASLPAAIPGRYLAANEQEIAGKALEWIGDVLYPDIPATDRYAAMNRVAAAVAPGSGGVIFTPWLFGERTPVEDATLRGGFFNQSLETGRAEMTRAVFEGVAFNSRWLLEHVERFAKRRLDPIVMVGGGARSELWCRIHADVLGRTIRRAEAPLLVNVRGVGLLTQVALGEIGWDDVGDLVPVAEEYAPDRSMADTYDRLYAAFRAIHKSNRRTYRKLNRPEASL